MKRLFILAFGLLIFVVVSCEDKTHNSTEKVVELKPSPKANADSLFHFVKSQVAFGPRVPGTLAHANAAEWFVSKFEEYGAQVTVQAFDANIYDGTPVRLKNVIASFNPSVKKRILLAAHWDTRPFSDRDSEDKYAKLDGANDGASGVAVLLEIARILHSQTAPAVGVDMILFDGEDWGEHNEEGGTDLPEGLDSWWALGSQYWSKNKHIANYSAFYGILLDMVGAPEATFYYDSVSQQNAGRVLNKVWDISHANGYQSYFKKQLGFTGIVDDHVFVNQYARIPMIDIIDFQQGSFTPVWHTQNDNLENISKQTLEVVSNVVLSVLYNE